MNWQTVIGLEVHAQLKTQTKLFSGAPIQYGAPANSQTSFIDAGLPGILPVLNQEAVHMAIKFGLSIQAEINDESYFERKNYFYPDLPKGYQISQYQRPIVTNGRLIITTSNGTTKQVDITRAHLEEDAGKSLHETHQDYTGIDLNRAGTPLLEIVTAPCLFSPDEAIAYLKTLHQLLRFLNICDGNMQEGSFRCDVNLSLRKKGSESLGTRTELKNLNSFRFIEKAILYEQLRHQDILEMGQTIHQETRLYSPENHATYALRSKESEQDYRYFPDPDLLPIPVTKKDIELIRMNMPPLPSEIKVNLKSKHHLPEQDIDFLLSSPALYQFFKRLSTKTHAPVKTVVNWLKGTYSAALNEAGLSFENPPVSSERMAQILDRLTDRLISVKMAKTIFAKLMNRDQDIDEIIGEEGFEQTIDPSRLEEMIRNVIKNHPKQAADYRAGKHKLMAFFVGQVIKKSKGAADPAQVSALLKKYLV